MALTAAAEDAIAHAAPLLKLAAVCGGATPSVGENATSAASAYSDVSAPAVSTASDFGPMYDDVQMRKLTALVIACGGEPAQLHGWYCLRHPCRGGGFGRPKGEHAATAACTYSWHAPSRCRFRSIEEAARSLGIDPSGVTSAAVAEAAAALWAQVEADAAAAAVAHEPTPPRRLPKQLVDDNGKAGAAARWKVEWEGLGADEASWLPRRELSAALIEQYERRCQ